MNKIKGRRYWDHTFLAKHRNINRQGGLRTQRWKDGLQQHGLAKDNLMKMKCVLFYLISFYIWIEGAVSAKLLFPFCSFKLKTYVSVCYVFIYVFLYMINV